MAFHLKAKESVSEGITRNVRKQLERALEHLGADSDAHARGQSETDAAGEIRRCFKRIRAALRLVREELGEEKYHRENRYFRDAARLLIQVRDAGILVETADKLRQQFPKAIPTATFAKITRALLTNQAEVGRRVLTEGKAFVRVKDAATRALARLADWKLEREGWAALAPGLRRVYRTGHRALALAAENASVARLHEWRKQTKYLWHQLQLLEPALTGVDQELVDKAHRLSTLLGEDHDLAVLRETLAAEPSTYGGHGALKGVFVLIDRQRADLERQAFALGREVYPDAPKPFTRRIAASLSCEYFNEKCHET
jgi:CHAD domain-containing protein